MAAPPSAYAPLWLRIHDLSAAARIRMEVSSTTDPCSGGPTRFEPTGGRDRISELGCALHLRSIGGADGRERARTWVSGGSGVKTPARQRRSRSLGGGPGGGATGTRHFLGWPQGQGSKKVASVLATILSEDGSRAINPYELEAKLFMCPRPTLEEHGPCRLHGQPRP